MAMSVEHSSKFAALHRQWWRLHMSGTENPKQTNKVCNETNVASYKPLILEYYLWKL